VLETTIPPFIPIGGERCSKSDSPGSLRDFIDGSEGQVVGDGLSDYGGGSDSDMSIEFGW
jgi:hypothetical protein